MSRKTLHRVVIIAFLAVLAVRLEQHFRIPHSTGFLLETGNFVPPENCEFHIPLVLHIADNHTLRLNSESVTSDHLSERLAMILGDRFLPILYVDASKQISMREFAEFLDAAEQSNDKIHIRLVTPGNRKYTCVDYQPGPAY